MRGDKQVNVVMVADDNMFVRFLVRKWLGDEAEIIEVATGQEVRSEYQKHNPDILFLDIHLPGRNGKFILKDILRDDPTAHVVMLSADSLKENVVDTVQGGAKAFITKPFTRDTLYRHFLRCPTVKPMAAPEAAANKTQPARK